MNSELTQLWDAQQAELSAQREPADHVDFCTTASADFPGLRLVGGVDISYPRTTTSTAVVALTVLSYPSLTPVYTHVQPVEVPHPYVAGYLAFREMPAYEQAFMHLRRTRPDLWPQVVLVDGNGTLHPRGFGSACHLGVVLDLPTVGVAKNLLHVEDGGMDAKEVKRAFAEDPELSEMRIGDRGVAVAPPKGNGARNPVFVSPGHRVCAETAVRLARCCSLYRVPEPIRVADQRSRDVVREIEKRQES
ncbi:hypothetical protein LPJ53_000834 [Coemansia erecta]|uniref:Endonuclease V n=1 Tax=Coemansia erecta TaxID=147472 RepID=A0A9W7Y7S9_9FUNG|nr:hypothetical protein LPJ53_000834 [Coemansia erecta]